MLETMLDTMLARGPATTLAANDAGTEAGEPAPRSAASVRVPRWARGARCPWAKDLSGRLPGLHAGLLSGQLEERREASFAKSAQNLPGQRLQERACKTGPGKDSALRGGPAPTPRGRATLGTGSPENLVVGGLALPRKVRLPRSAARFRPQDPLPPFDSLRIAHRVPGAAKWLDPGSQVFPRREEGRRAVRSSGRPRGNDSTNDTTLCSSLCARRPSRLAYPQRPTPAPRSLPLLPLAEPMKSVSPFATHRSAPDSPAIPAKGPRSLGWLAALACAGLGLTGCTETDEDNAPFTTKTLSQSVASNAVLAVTDRYLAFPASELGTGSGGTDYNGDGDVSDDVVTVVVLGNDQVIPLGVALHPGANPATMLWVNEVLFLVVSESADGVDWNSDMDTSDDVLLYWHFNLNRPAFYATLGDDEIYEVGGDVLYAANTTPGAVGETNIARIDVPSTAAAPSAPEALMTSLTDPGGDGLLLTLRGSSDGVAWLTASEVDEGADLNGGCRRPRRFGAGPVWRGFQQRNPSGRTDRPRREPARGSPRLRRQSLGGVFRG